MKKKISVSKTIVLSAEKLIVWITKQRNQIIIYSIHSGKKVNWKFYILFNMHL